MSSFKIIILEINNLKKYHNVCHYALQQHTINVILGETGYGKTISRQALLQRNKDNIVYVNVEKSTTPRTFYSNIFNTISNEKYDPKLPLNILIKRVANQFVSKKSDMLLLVDEVTKFDHNFFEHLQDFWELSKQNTGIVLSGCNYFNAKFNKWNKVSKNGMPEFYSRIDNWVLLDPPTKNEISSIIKAYEIHDNAFEKSCFDVLNFRELVDNRIRKYLIVKNRINEGDFTFIDDD